MTTILQSQKTRKLLGPESFPGLFSGDFLGSRKVFLKETARIQYELFGTFSRVGHDLQRELGNVF